MCTFRSIARLSTLLLVLSLLVLGCNTAPGASPTTSSQASSSSAPSASGAASPAPSGAPIKIGLINPTSGPYASLTAPFGEGASLAVARINAAGGINGRKLEIVTLDSQGDPQTTFALVKQMAADRAVVAILGTTPIVAGQAAAVVAQQEGVVLIVQGSTRSLYDGRNYVFTIATAEDVSAAGELQFMTNKLGFKKIGVFQDPSDYGRDQTKAFLELASKANVQILPESYKFEDVDATPQVMRLKSAGVEGIVIVAAQPKVPAIILKNMDALGWKVPVLGGVALANAQFLQLAGPLSEGMYFETNLASSPTGLQRPLRKGLSESYAALGKQGDPTVFHGISWDAVNLVASGLAKAGPDRAKLREAMEQTKGFEGATGILNMSPQDHSGRSLEAVNIVQVDKGQFKFIWAPDAR